MQAVEEHNTPEEVSPVQLPDDEFNPNAMDDLIDDLKGEFTEDLSDELSADHLSKSREEMSAAAREVLEQTDNPALKAKMTRFLNRIQPMSVDVIMQDDLKQIVKRYCRDKKFAENVYGNVYRRMEKSKKYKFPHPSTLNGARQVLDQEGLSKTKAFKIFQAAMFVYMDTRPTSVYGNRMMGFMLKIKNLVKQPDSDESKALTEDLNRLVAYYR